MGRMMNPTNMVSWKLLAPGRRRISSTGRCYYRWRHQPNGNAGQRRRAQVSGRRVCLDDRSGRQSFGGTKARSLRHRAGVYQERWPTRTGGISPKGQRLKARRIHAFGKAVYPQHFRKNWKVRALWTLLSRKAVCGSSIAKRTVRLCRAQVRRNVQTQVKQITTTRDQRMALVDDGLQRFCGLLPIIL